MGWNSFMNLLKSILEHLPNHLGNLLYMPTMFQNRITEEFSDVLIYWKLGLSGKSQYFVFSTPALPLQGRFPVVDCVCMTLLLICSDRRMAKCCVEVQVGAGGLAGRTQSQVISYSVSSTFLGWIWAAVRTPWTTRVSPGRGLGGCEG